jgi:hypothetical protein
MSRRIRRFRIAVVILLMLLAVPVVSGYVTSSDTVDGATPAGTASPSPSPGDGTATPGNTSESVRVGNGITVAVVDAVGPPQIVAYGPDGETIYQDSTHQIYHDVDPSPAGEATVTYVVNNRNRDASNCEGPERCMLNIWERVNLTTGERTELYSWYTPMPGSAQVHDVDRVNDSVLLVGKISFPDGVYMVNTTTGEKIWEWNVSEDYAPESGGVYPDDWTHLNDVEYLHDGRVMANLRNQDQVVFLDPGEGLQEDWTLGEDGDHDILYEQHNADYIPAERGGPAILVADSENARIVEYQRANGSWELSWLWEDSRLQWPRDADRLPNGNTLIADSHGKRILEVNEDGEIVSKRDFVQGGYDVELLGTGDESTGGYSMQFLQRTGSNNGTPVGNATPPGAVTAYVQSGCDGAVGCLREFATDLTPSLLLNGALYVLPHWVTPLGGVAVLLQGVIVLGWAGTEVVIRRDRLIGAITRSDSGG